jgi:regulatory protein
LADSYTYALTLLARRELSVAQLRERLVRQEFPDNEIEDTLDRLRASRAIDDGRVARAHAQTAARVKGRGRARVVKEVEALGIDRTTAREAVAEVFGELDEDALLARALDKRLRGRRIKDATETRRLHQYLMRQGFEPGKVMRALKDRGGDAS